MVKLQGYNEACLFTGNFHVCILHSFFLLPLPFGLCHIVGSSMHKLKFLPSRNCLVSVCPCCLFPLDFSDVMEHHLLPWQRSAVCGLILDDYRSALLHCFSSQLAETSFVLQYISSCVINMLNQFRAYVSAYHCRKYISQRASHAPFCVRAATLLLAFMPLSGITLLVWRKAYGKANFWCAIALNSSS